MNTTFVRALLFVVLAGLSLAPSAASQGGGGHTQQVDPCFCKARQFPTVFYNPCVSGMGFTTSISPGMCQTFQCQERFCHWNVTLFYELKEECGGPSDVLVLDNGDLECGSGMNWDWSVGGAPLAHVAFICEQCKAHGG